MTVNGPSLLVEVGLFDVLHFHNKSTFFLPFSTRSIPTSQVDRLQAAAIAAEAVEETLLRNTVLAEDKKGGKSARELALKYPMSPAAIGRVVSGKTQPSSKRGRATTLPPEIKEEFAKALICRSNALVGFDPDAFWRKIGLCRDGRRKCVGERYIKKSRR